MYKIYKLYVAKGYIYANTKTGEITGQTYNAKEWIKENFEATWDKDKRCWKADTEVVAKELENHYYYDKYISEVETIVEDDDLVEDGVELKINGVIVDPSEVDIVVSEELVNRDDGFWTKKTHKSGKITYSFLG